MTSHWHRFHTLSLLFSLFLTSEAIAGQGAARTHLRPLQPWIAAAIDRAIDRTPTLARLVAEAARHRLIVYVDECTERDQTWDGRAAFLSYGNGYRYVRVEVKKLPADMTAAIVTHELQHGIEMAAGDVRSESDFVTLFRRIGHRVRGPHEQYDTSAAVAAGLSALEELTGRTLSPPPHAASALRRHRAQRASQ